VNVRGLGPQYNITTLNNRILATDDDGRDLAFDVLPSEVISGADVLKSTQASALEGSIGGTVNLRTASPFDNPGLSRRGACRGQRQRHVGPQGQQIFRLHLGHQRRQHLGFLLGGVHSDTKIRTDSLNAYNQNIYGPTTYPFTDPNGTASSVPLSPPHRAASPSDPSSTTRSATRSPAASSGVPARTSR
jgi:iron complex outermembrane receptor protein